MSRSLILAAAAGLFASSVAFAAEPAPYLGAHLGTNLLDHWPARVDFGGVTASGEAALDSGLHGGLMLGRQTEHARFEMEYQRGAIELNSLKLGPLNRSADGTGHYDAVTVNAYRTHDFNERWSAFAGAGIGWGKVRMPSGRLEGCECFASASESGLVYQGRIGVEYRLARAHSAFAQYSLLRLPGASGGGTPQVAYEDRTIGSVTVGYRMLF
ncbi:outer membrane protein [Gulbenkiania mobilis]|uniref:Opacity protein-like surface antigen n=1 Tax=Gulbenkiania mobilis TaxID=397457 RepID=A0ABY2CWY0_GULMO|nr:opacity protein-like surface antigen [Gulbenkiania mobilis]